MNTKCSVFRSTFTNVFCDVLKFFNVFFFKFLCERVFTPMHFTASRRHHYVAWSFFSLEASDVDAA